MAVHGRAPQAISAEGTDILITCVDTALARRTIGAALGEGSPNPTYWLDLGNRAGDGQFLIGCPVGPGRWNDARLPTVLEAFPELADDTAPEDDTPSCSVAEALERNRCS
jgi:hypothetical protein